MLTGSNRGRMARRRGITISRARDGPVVENYAALDSLQLKQVGLWRVALATPRLLRALRERRRTRPA